ncbi:MAG: IS1595 family transposase [Alphaproteobacteria bacterium]
MSVLNEKHFHDEAAAYKWVESRVWANGVVCPHCGSVDQSYALKGKTTRIGLKKCGECRKPFTVKVGTIFEDSHVKMHIWLQAIFLMCSSKKGISSNQLHRTLGVTLKTAWFMSHRIREAMNSGGGLEPMGGEGKPVEVDETYIGRNSLRKKGGGGGRHKNVVFAMVERGGEMRSHHVPDAKAATIAPIMVANIHPDTPLMTDEASQYKTVGKNFKSHEVVQHSLDEYVRGDVTTNSIEGAFSVFKRGMKGVYQHCSEKHLHRYLSEFDFRYNARIALGVDDAMRTEKAVCGIVGKRLTYRTTARG